MFAAPAWCVELVYCYLDRLTIAKPGQSATPGRCAHEPDPQHRNLCMSAAWIADADACSQWIDRNRADVIGLDTEFMRRNTFHPKLALVQIAAGGACALVDPTAFDAGTCIRKLVGERVWIMHSASEDMEALAPLLDGTNLRLFDTQIAAALCGLGFGLSYRNLVSSLLGVEIPKDETRSDWLHRPLTPAQINYAEQDVAHLHELHALLETQLAQQIG